MKQIILKNSAGADVPVECREVTAGQVRELVGGSWDAVSAMATEEGVPGGFIDMTVSPEGVGDTLPFSEFSKLVDAVREVNAPFLGRIRELGRQAETPPETSTSPSAGSSGGGTAAS